MKAILIFSIISLSSIFLAHGQSSMKELWSKGNKAIESKDYSSAIVFYTKVIDRFDSIRRENPDMLLIKSEGSFIEIYPILFNRAIAKYELNDNRGAIKDIERYLVEYPQNSIAHMIYGLASIKIGKKDEGCLSLSKSGELGNSKAYEYITRYCNN